MSLLRLTPLVFAFAAASAFAQDAGAPASEPAPLPPAAETFTPAEAPPSEAPAVEAAPAYGVPATSGPAELTPHQDWPSDSGGAVPLAPPANSAPTATAPTTSIVPAAPRIMGRQAPGSVEVGTLGTPEGPLAGTLDDTNGGLGSGEWDGVDRGAAEEVLGGLPDATSPTVRLLLRKLLLTTAPPPAGQTAVPFNAVRMRALLHAGMLADAAAIAAQVRAPKDPDTSRVQAGALLFAGDDANACGDATAMRLDSDEQFWIELRAYCYALAKDPALDLTRSVLAGADPAFNALLDGVISGKPRANVAFAHPTALHVRMMERLKLPVNQAVADLGTPGAVIAALSATTPKPIRLASAERALRAGAEFPPGALGQVLDLATFKPGELATATALAHSDSPIMALARLRAALKREGDPVQRAELLNAAFRVADEQGLLHQVAPLFAADAVALIPRPDWINWAPAFVRALLIAGRPDAAESWRAIMDADPALIAGAHDDLAILFALAVRDDVHVQRAQPALSNLAAQSLAGGDANGARAVLVFGLFDALGIAIPPEAQARVQPMVAQQWPGRRPSAAAMQRIEAASLHERRGETALGTIAVIGSGAGDLAPDVTVRLVRALQTAGVHDGAHALAMEAILSR